MSTGRVYSHNQAHGHSRQHVGDVHHYHSLGAQQHERLQGSLRDLSTKHDAHFSRLEHAITSQADREKCDRILSSLTYDSIHSRREEVPEAAAATFEWIYQDDDFSTTTFRTWLTTHTGSGLCWIYGKPGSGKSTPMKFIYDQGKTGDMLESWAGDRQLFIAQHHFWYPGTNIQKSQDGLLRSLLYQICSEGVTLLPTIFPSRWTSHRARKPWSVKELIDAIGMLRTVTSTAYCFFIDGLDEYQPQDRHIQLAKDLLGLACSSNIKICASSRPWEAFQAAFGPVVCRLRLEDLTQSDLRAFAAQNIGDTFTASHEQSDSLAAEISSLVDDIVHKARGVFLWVRLVVSALCERIPLVESRSELRARLDGVPSDLEEYFRVMIYDIISPTWITGSETARFLKLALVARSHVRYLPPWVSWRTYYVAKNLEQNSAFSGDCIGPGAALQRIIEVLKQYGLTIQSLSADLNVAYVDVLKKKFPALHTLIDQVDSRFTQLKQLDNLRILQMDSRRRFWPPLHDRDSGFLVRAMWSEVHIRLVWIRDSPSRGKCLPISIPADAKWVLKQAKHERDYVDVWEQDLGPGPSWWKRFELP